MIEIKHYPYKQGLLWYKEARDLLLKDFWFWIKLTIGYLLVVFIWNYLFSSLTNRLNFVTMLPLELVQSYFGIGLVKLVIDRRHGNPLSLELLFEPLKKGAGAMKCLSILISYTLIPFVVLFFILMLTSALGISFLNYPNLFNLIKSQSLSLASFETIMNLFADSTLLAILKVLCIGLIGFSISLIGIYDCSITEAVKLSAKATFKNIGAFGVQFGIGLLGVLSIILTLGLGMFFWGPLFFILGGLFFEDVFKVKNAPNPPSVDLALN